MAFKLEREQEPKVVTIKSGTMRGGDNEAGVNLSLNVESGTIDGNIHFGNVETSIKDRNELVAAVEEAINNVFKCKL